MLFTPITPITRHPSNAATVSTCVAAGASVSASLLLKLAIGCLA
jgi:hypothetical protein